MDEANEIGDQLIAELVNVAGHTIGLPGEAQARRAVHSSQNKVASKKGDRLPLAAAGSILVAGRARDRERQGPRAATGTSKNNKLRIER